MKAENNEQAFDEGVDLTASLDSCKARRVLQAQKRVNVDFPTWMIDSLDREASKLGSPVAEIRGCSDDLLALAGITTGQAGDVQ